MKVKDDFDFFGQFGMSKEDAEFLAKEDDLKYIIEFESEHVEELVTSMHTGYDDKHQKWLMKKSVMIAAMKERKLQLESHGFCLNIDSPQFEFKAQMIFSELSVSLIKI